MTATTPDRIDEEINKYLSLVSDLRTQKNLFRPIFRLPSEILANIFILARDSCDDSIFDFQVPRWVTLTYVCRHWRNVALTCPTLWSYHFTASLRWTEELLARSKQALLKICICIYYGSERDRSWWSRLVEKVLDHGERIQEFRLHVPDTSYLPLQLSLYAPRLQILDISSSWYDLPERTFKISHADTLPLRILKLTHYPPSGSFNLAGVTTLSLRLVPAPSRQNIVEFLATLSRMQALVVLRLEHALLSARGFLSGSALGASPKVCLPHLTRLSVIAPLSTTTVLLSCTDLPLNAYIWLEIEPEDTFEDDYTPISSVLAQRFSQSECLPPRCQTIRSLVIRCFDYEPMFTVCASERDDHNPKLLTRCLSPDCDLPLIIRIRKNQSVNTSDRVWSDICRSVPSTHVRVLHVVNPPLIPHFWEKTLGYLDGLRRLKLSKGWMPPLAPFLSLPVDEPRMTNEHDPTPGQTFVPALERLDLYRISFPSDDLAEDVASRSERSLRKALSSRGERPRLWMIKCCLEGESEDEDRDEDWIPSF